MQVISGLPYTKTGTAVLSKRSRVLDPLESLLECASEIARQGLTKMLNGYPYALLPGSKKS